MDEHQNSLTQPTVTNGRLNVKGGCSPTLGKTDSKAGEPSGKSRYSTFATNKAAGKRPKAARKQTNGNKANENGRKERH